MVGRTAGQGVVLIFVMSKEMNKKNIVLWDENHGCPFPPTPGFKKVIITSNVARIPFRRKILKCCTKLHKTWQGSISCADMNGCSHSKTSSCSAWFWFNHSDNCGQRLHDPDKLQAEREMLQVLHQPGEGRWESKFWIQAIHFFACHI